MSQEPTQLPPFSEVYAGLSSSLSTLEEQRQTLVSTANQGWLMTLAAVLAGVGCAAPLLAHSPPAALAVGVAFAIGTGVIQYRYVIKPGQTYRSLFKEGFMRPVVSSVNLEYSPSGLVARTTYEASRLFTKDVDRYQGDDLMSGRLGQTDIAMSELHTEYKTTSTDSKGRRRTQWHTIFRGWFVVADFHKSFQGETYVHPDSAQRWLGSFGQSLQKLGAGHRGELVKLEDPEFEREFVVYSTDQVEARFLLSTSMMGRMLAVRNRFDCRVHFSFVDSKVFMAFEINRPLFEPQFRTNVLDTTYLSAFYEQLAACIGVVDDLALNLRIWGNPKQKQAE